MAYFHLYHWFSYCCSPQVHKQASILNVPMEKLAELKIYIILPFWKHGNGGKLGLTSKYQPFFKFKYKLIFCLFVTIIVLILFYDFNIFLFVILWSTLSWL